MPAIILGDVHLEKGLNIGKPGIGSGLNSRIADQLDILDWVLEKAIDNIIDNIVITGDVFEHPKPSPAIISLFLDWLKKCGTYDIKIHLITGNHDILRSGQYYMSAFDVISSVDLENVFVYNNISSFHTDGISFTFLPFRDRRSFNKDSNLEALNCLGRKIPYFLSGMKLDNLKVLVGHIAIDGSIPTGDEIDDMTNELFCPIKMFAGYDYVWMGHIHKPQILSKKPFVAHIGSMDISDFGEANQKKNIAIIDKNNNVEYIEIPTRPLKQIDIAIPNNIIDTTEFVINNLKDINLKKSILKLNIDFGSNDLPSIDKIKIENFIKSSGVFHIHRFSESRKLSIVKKEMSKAIDNTVNEITAIKMYASSNIEENIRSDFISLANSIISECNSENK